MIKPEHSISCLDVNAASVRWVRHTADYRKTDPLPQTLGTTCPTLATLCPPIVRRLLSCRDCYTSTARQSNLRHDVPLGPCPHLSSSETPMAT